MADSVGIGFPRTNIQQGHIFFDLDEQATWQFLGGDPTAVASWKLLSGRFITNPNTSTWGNAQAGAMWFNVSELVYKGWDGTSVVTVGAGSGATPVANVLLLFGPNAVPQALGANAPINDILVTIGVQGGPIILRANTEILNAPAANPVVTITIAKNGVALPNATRIVTMQAQSRTTIEVETVDLNAATNDEYTIRAATTIPGVSHEITAGQTELVTQTLGLTVATIAELLE